MNMTNPQIHIGTKGFKLLESKAITGPPQRPKRVPDGVEHAIEAGANTAKCGMSTSGYDLILWPGIAWDHLGATSATRCPKCVAVMEPATSGA